METNKKEDKGEEMIEMSIIGCQVKKEINHTNKIQRRFWDSNQGVEDSMGESEDIIKEGQCKVK